MTLDGLYVAPEAIRDATCEVCPAQLLAFGRFDVSDKPGADTQYDRDAAGQVVMVVHEMTVTQSTNRTAGET